MMIYLPNSPPLNVDDPVSKQYTCHLHYKTNRIHLPPSYSTLTFKLDYTPKHMQRFLDQVHANVISGFVPNQKIPDPNFGKCIQCAAIDRARYKSNPPLVRSDFCSRCFEQYCYDPKNSPSSSELLSRILTFVDPDPSDPDPPVLPIFISRAEVGIIIGFVSVTLVIAAIGVFMCVSPNL
jgi:lysophospholipase